MILKGYSLLLKIGSLEYFSIGSLSVLSQYFRFYSLVFQSLYINKKFLTNLEHKNIISKTVQAIFWLISYNFIAWISQSFTKIYKNYWKIRKNEKYYIKSNSNNFLSDFKLFYGLDFQSLYIIKNFLKTFEHAKLLYLKQLKISFG